MGTAESLRNATIQTEHVLCNQCGIDDAQVIATGTDREYYTSTEQFSIVRCRHCGLIYLNPRPVLDELSRIYPSAYHSYILDEAVESKGSFVTRMRQSAGAKRFRPVMRHLSKFDTIDLLDVGCGNGWMMQIFKSFNPDAFARLVWRSVNQSVTRPGASVTRFTADRFQDVALDRQFDVINLTHVIEHVSDPRLVTRKARDALKPGGILVLETPNIGSVEWPHFSTGEWGAYHIPRHWYFYNQDTVKALGDSGRIHPS